MHSMNCMTGAGLLLAAGLRQNLLLDDIQAAFQRLQRFSTYLLLRRAVTLRLTVVVLPLLPAVNMAPGAGPCPTPKAGPEA